MSVTVQTQYRPLRGSRLEDFYPPIPAEGPSLSNLDSAFQLQEYISLLVRQNPHDVETIVATPEKVKTASTSEEKVDDTSEKEGKTDIVVEESSWIYEQLRRLAQDLTHPLITSLQLECTRASCPEMKAGEWLYLCVAHGQEGALEQCCAIDYIIHTLDSATALLNSPRAFPSRLTIPPASVRHFPSLARRLGRIFAHAYFHHREAFEHAEAESSLYARFLALTERFKLVPAEFLVIPSASQSVSNEETEAPRMPAAMGPPTSASESGAEQQKSGSETAGESTSGASSTAAETQLEGGSDGDAQARRSASPEKSPGGASGMESPRKMGRSRTDTMIFSDAAAYSEELRSASSGSGGRGFATIGARSPARPSGRDLWGENTPAEKAEPKKVDVDEDYDDDGFVPLDYTGMTLDDEQETGTSAQSDPTTNFEPTNDEKHPPIDHPETETSEEIEDKEEAATETKSDSLDDTNEPTLNNEDDGGSHEEPSAATAESSAPKEIEEISSEPEELHSSTTDPTTETSKEEPPHEPAVDHSEVTSSETKEEEPKQDDAAEFVVVDDGGKVEEHEESHTGGSEETMIETADTPPPEDQEAPAATTSEHDTASAATDAENAGGEATTIAEEKKDVDAPVAVVDDVPELVPQ